MPCREVENLKKGRSTRHKCARCQQLHVAANAWCSEMREPVLSCCDENEIKPNSRFQQNQDTSERRLFWSACSGLDHLDPRAVFSQEPLVIASLAILRSYNTSTLFSYLIENWSGFMPGEVSPTSPQPHRPSPFYFLNTEYNLRVHDFLWLPSVKQISGPFFHSTWLWMATPSPARRKGGGHKRNSMNSITVAIFAHLCNRFFAMACGCLIFTNR